MPRRLTVLLVLASSITSCAEPAEPTEPTVTSHVVRREIPLQRHVQLDLLFVIDSSPAIATHRPTLVANARTLVDVLGTIPGGPPDLHLGIVTTDVGTRGAGDSTSTAHGDCSPDGDAGAPLIEGSVTGRFLSDAPQLDGSRVTNYTGELGQIVQASFDRIAAGTGCSFVRPLEAMRRALANPENAGFLRPGAYLAVVFLTAQDDCSFQHASFLDGATDTFGCVADPAALVPVADYVSFLHSLKQDPTQIVVMGAFGPASPFVADPATRTVEPSCTIDARAATPGVRLQAFLDQFPNRSSFTSLCQSDLTDAFGLLSQLFKVTLGVACFDDPIPDADPITPGAQYDCAASIVETFADRTDERLMLRCQGDAVPPPGTSGPCWQLVADPQTCPTGGQKLSLANAFASADANRSLAILECVIE
jgi:hypothetical protein